MIRVLITTGLYPPESGGPATYTKLLEEKLPELGFEVRVLPFRTVRHLPPVVRHIAYFWKCLRLARQAGVVYAQDTVSVGLPSALASMFAGKKFMVRVPGDYAWEQARQRFGVVDELDEFQSKRYGLRVELLRSVQRFVVRRAQAVVVPSVYMQKVISGWGVAPVLVYNGIDLPVPTKEPQMRPEGFLVVSSGRRVPWKGFEQLERVVLSQKEWNLFIAENLPRAQALGWVKAADVYVLNSTYEGLSHQLLEAMALGTPIIATAVGGNPELIEGCGLLIAAQDDTALRAAIAEVQNNPAAARERAQRALERVKEFDVNKTLVQLAALLRSV